MRPHTRPARGRRTRGETGAKEATLETHAIDARQQRGSTRASRRGIPGPFGGGAIAHCPGRPCTDPRPTTVFLPSSNAWHHVSWKEGIQATPAGVSHTLPNTKATLVSLLLALPVFSGKGGWEVTCTPPVQLHVSDCCGRCGDGSFLRTSFLFSYFDVAIPWDCLADQQTSGAAPVATVTRAICRTNGFADARRSVSLSSC